MIDSQFVEIMTRIAEIAVANNVKEVFAGIETVMFRCAVNVACRALGVIVCWAIVYIDSAGIPIRRLRGRGLRRIH